MKNNIVRTLLLSCAICMCGQASAVVIDDFTSGTSFTATNVNGTDSYSGPGVLGGNRDIRYSPVFGINVTDLDTSAGELSVSTTKFSDTFIRYGTTATGGSELNLALNASSTFEVDFSTFDLGLFDSAGGDDGLFFSVIDGIGNTLGFTVAGSVIAALDASGGGTLVAALGDFTNFGSYNGEIDGIQFGLDDRDFALATMTEFRLNGVTVPAPATFLLLLMGLVGLSAKRH